jgi:hypothetical protein
VTSSTDKPCRGSKKQAGRRCGRRLAGDAGVHAGDGIATVVEDLGDVLHLLRPLDAVGRGLGGLVGVERPLVVGVSTVVELPSGQVEVEALQLDPQRGSRPRR